MVLAIARCENCGAALRFDPRSTQVTCKYCQVTSYVRDAPAGAPRVEIAAPPEPLDETRKLVVGAAIGALGVIAGLGAIVHGLTGGAPVDIFGGVGLVLGFGLVLSLCALSYGREKRRVEGVRTLRDSGLPARATVRSLGAGEGRAANLKLVVETDGSTRDMAHETTIPALLVPKVTSGLTLPVLVHPSDPDHIEIQWHLL